MIIARGEFEGKEMLLLGLSRGNVDRLTAGQPIRLTRETHGEAMGRDEAILILFGETEQDLYDSFVREGLVDARTETRILPRKAPS